MLEERRTIGGITINLKPCPFCGNNATYYVDNHENGDTTYIHIIRCNTFLCVSMSESISYYQPDWQNEVKNFCKKWNNRVMVE